MTLIYLDLKVLLRKKNKFSEKRGLSGFNKSHPPRKKRIVKFLKIITNYVFSALPALGRVIYSLIGLGHGIWVRIGPVFLSICQTPLQCR